MWNPIKKVQSKIAETNTAWSAHALGRQGFQYLGQGSSDPVAMQKALEAFGKAQRMFRSIDRDDLAHTLTNNTITARWTLRHIFRADIEIDPGAELLESLFYFSQKKDGQHFFWAWETLHQCVSMDINLYRREQVQNVCELTYDAVQKGGFLTRLHRLVAIGYLVQIIYMYGLDRHFPDIQSLYSEMVDGLEAINEQQKLFQFKMFIAFAIVDRVRHADNMLFEQAIATLQQLASHPMVARDDRMLCRVLFGLGKGYRNRTLGDKKNNADVALASFKSAELLTDRSTDFDHWLKCKFMLVESFVDYKPYILESHKIPLVTRTVIDADPVADSDHLASELASRNDLALLSYANLLRLKIRTLYLQEPISSHLDEMASAAWLVSETHRGNALSLYAGACIQTFVEQDREPEHLKAAAAALEDAVTADEANVRLNNLCASLIMLANVRLLQGEWLRANEHFERVFQLVGDDIALGTSHFDTKAVLGMTGPVLAYSCFAAAAAGNVSAALSRYELLHARLTQETIAPESENREPGGLTLQNLEALSMRAADSKTGADRSAYLDALAAVRNSAIQQNQTERVSIAEVVATTDHWLICPFFSLTQFCCVLIPPGSSLEEAVVSPIVNKGYLDLVGFLRTPSRTGFADAVDHITRDEENPFGDLIGAILDVPDFVDELFGDWLASELRRRGVEVRVKIAIISAGILNQLPLALSGYTGQEATALGQRHDVSIAPSLFVLSRLRELDNQVDCSTPVLAVLTGPSEKGLETAKLEVELISRHFGSSDENRVLPIAFKSELAERLPQAHYWHFTSHGKFDFADPMKSYFKMADKTPYTLAETATLKMPQMPVRLAVLAACFLGHDDYADPYRDYASFPNAFIQMGVLGVIAAIWPVSDEATTLLMARFYEEHIYDGKPPASALRSAQHWLSESKAEDLMVFIRQRSQLSHNGPAVLELLQKLASFQPDDRPFQHPFFWAGFGHYGA